MQVTHDSGCAARPCEALTAAASCVNLDILPIYSIIGVFGVIINYMKLPEFDMTNEEAT